MKKQRCWKVTVHVDEGSGTYPFSTYKVMAHDDNQARDMAIDIAQEEYVGVEGKRATIAFCDIRYNGWIHYDG